MKLHILSLKKNPRNGTFIEMGGKPNSNINLHHNVKINPNIYIPCYVSYEGAGGVDRVQEEVWVDGDFLQNCM